MFFNRDKYRITLTGDEYDLIIKLELFTEK